MLTWTLYHSVTPDVSFLPKKFQPFVMPSVRRLHLDISDSSELKRKLEEAERRIKSLEEAHEASVKRVQDRTKSLEAAEEAPGTAYEKWMRQAIIWKQSHTSSSHVPPSTGSLAPQALDPSLRQPGPSQSSPAPTPSGSKRKADEISSIQASSSSGNSTRGKRRHQAT
ncbi:hypothetical protein HGRIS_005081 [Hohenbuehelia grisea]|uniref:Uncharacterized protein n=1 Tax=Hohenbuehelia grisea TaxID=104357 RepID=A0ABR3JDW1_9AGAR